MCETDPHNEICPTFDYVGLGKTLFSSSICHVQDKGHGFAVETFLTERITRQKGSGLWPSQALNIIKPRLQNITYLVENRDVITPKQREWELNKLIPFFDHLEKSNLDHFSAHYNNSVEFATHHLCHATCAAAISPFYKSIIIVVDGAGSSMKDFLEESEEYKKFCQNSSDLNNDRHELCSVYLQIGTELECVHKEWQHFQQSKKYPRHSFSNGPGTLYEKASEFIFNDKRASGKVMGLAPFGKSSSVVDRFEYLEELDWSRAYSGGSKQEWESSENMQLYCNIAATVQKDLELYYQQLIQKMKNRYGAFDNIILAGGCALNCTNNMRIHDQNLFKRIYIPPFPGDEGIGFGSAFHAYFRSNENRKTKWKPTPFSDQVGYFGPVSSIPSKEVVENVFKDMEITKPQSIVDFAADLLMDSRIIAWFQGRSECGPRALGNRSILSRIDYPNLKDYLNREVKFRESFRPYGCSCLDSFAHVYFDVAEGFNNPFMSFATKVRGFYLDLFKEVTHIDNTSRMQTVTENQNSLFFNLLKSFGDKSGTYVLLNTSLNIMGEPIVESVEDARLFLEKTDVFGICIGEYFIKKRIT